jgi:hypothetical protein
MHAQIKYALWIYALVFITGTITVVYRVANKTGLPVMDKTYFYLFKVAIDGWALSHFIMHALLGFFAPNYWCIILLWGVIFEYIEKAIEDSFSLPFKSKLMTDPIINTAGYLVGFTLQHVFKCKKKIK